MAAAPVDDSEIEDAMLEYAQCMRDNGIDMPDPEFEDGGGVHLGFDSESGIDPESEEFKAAEEACESIMEEVRPDVQLSPEEQAEMQDRLVALAECMRARGHDMPDPQVGEDGGVTDPSRGGAARPRPAAPVLPTSSSSRTWRSAATRPAWARAPWAAPSGNSSSEDDE